ncbi:pentapeptide repeat-containing protein [Parendozoicomonas haliclonae]|uniref:Inward rectifier potassium channel Kirbac3.1 n=1 Tax=Parendozoicomonas haliclonae TaxID=1960125 RepID=A0A1X7AHZ8_9GAMM|nr:pentapeptide repeat-containing protein [Parendozoicomonas haliclonae]SMA43902.1 Inward rectifier potassium channel Kirbac3.1 [Parendozoicomonas haliclonae]
MATEPALSQDQRPTCSYSGCRDTCDHEQNFCFWHNPHADKSGDDIAGRLEELVRDGRSLEGFQLARANLKGLRLVPKIMDARVDLSKVNLYRADLRGAHLYKANLRQASLLKADLTGANLNFADLSFANLLGVKLDDSRMEHVQWGKILFQEQELKQGFIGHNPSRQLELYGEAEEVCRSVRRSCEAHGLFDEAGYFFHKEMTLRRKQYPLGSWQRWMSKLVDVLCGYGERPFRVFIFSSGLVLMCAMFYFMVGLGSGGEIIRFEFQVPWYTNVSNFLDALYFSVVTFTTLGYGDLIPLGPSRTMAAMEAFIGNFTLALFVVVFVKKMTR